MKNDKSVVYKWRDFLSADKNNRCISNKGPWAFNDNSVKNRLDKYFAMEKY